MYCLLIGNNSGEFTQIEVELGNNHSLSHTLTACPPFLSLCLSLQALYFYNPSLSLVSCLILLPLSQYLSNTPIQKSILNSLLEYRSCHVLVWIYTNMFDHTYCSVYANQALFFMFLFHHSFSSNIPNILLPHFVTSSSPFTKIEQMANCCQNISRVLIVWV